MADPSAGNSFLQRLIGAAALDPAIYEEVEADPRATSQALIVVLGSSIATGIGVRPLGAQTIYSVCLFSTIALVTWVAWALLTFQIGTRLLPDPATRSDPEELLRTIGFAAVPGLLRVLGVMPAVLVPVFIGTTIWTLLAMVVAVRHALDYRHTSRAVAVCVLGWLLSLAAAAVLGIVFAPTVS